MDNSQRLDMYDDALLEIEHRCKEVKINIEEYGYHKIVTKKLDDYGTNIYNATDEQWYSASEYAANMLYWEVRSKELKN